MIAVEDISGSSSLNHLKLVDGTFCVGIPHCASIFQKRAHKGFVCCCFELSGVYVEISAKEG